MKERKYKYWWDAKKAAREASDLYGHAWIIGTREDYILTGSRYVVRTSEDVGDAPEEFSAEFKDGQEQ